MSGSQPLEELRASHKAMLEALVQVLEKVLYPLLDMLPEVESIIAKAEKPEASEERQEAPYEPAD